MVGAFLLVVMAAGALVGGAGVSSGTGGFGAEGGLVDGGLVEGCGIRGELGADRKCRQPNQAARPRTAAKIIHPTRRTHRTLTPLRGGLTLVGAIGSALSALVRQCRPETINHRRAVPKSLLLGGGQGNRVFAHPSPRHTDSTGEGPSYCR